MDLFRQLEIDRFEAIYFYLLGLCSLILSCAKIGVGVNYQDECGGFETIPYYLYVSGGFELVLNIFQIITGLYSTYFYGGKILAHISIGLSLLIRLSLNIWGSSIVFGKFSISFNSNRNRSSAGVRTIE